jgi:hypothetical protein
MANQKRYNNGGETNKTKDKLEFIEQTSNINHICLHIYFFRSVNICRGLAFNVPCLFVVFVVFLCGTLTSFTMSPLKNTLYHFD